MKSLILKLLSIFFIVLLSESCKITTSNEVKFSTELVHGKYKVVNFDNKNLEEQNLTIFISPDEKLILGFSGCNNYQYTYTLLNDKLNLGNVTTSDMYCEETQKLENEFLQHMSSATRVILNKEELILTNKDKSFFIKALKNDKK